MTPEGKVKAKVKKLLDTYGAYHFSPNMAGYGRSGVPDIIACVAGRFVAVECKAGKNMTTALQRREVEKIRKSFGIAVVIREDNLDYLENILKTLTKYTRGNT